MSEGGHIPLGTKNSISTTVDGVTLNVIGRKYVLLALKLQSANVHGLLKILNFTVTYLAAAGKVGFYELQLHSTVGSIGSVTGTLTFNNISSSIAKYAIGNGTQYIDVGQNGYILNSGFVSSRLDVLLQSVDFETLLARTNVTTYDTFILSASGNVSNDLMFGSINFIESE